MDILNCVIAKKLSGGGGMNEADLEGLYMTSPNGTLWEINVADDGGVTAKDPSKAFALIDRTISGHVSDKELTEIGGYAFNGCMAIKSVEFPAVTTVGNGAFGYCSALTSVDLPAVTSIGASAFSGCEALTSVAFPAVTTVGNSAFSYCPALTSVDLPAVTNLGESVFYDCYALTSLVLRSDTVCALAWGYLGDSFAEGKGYIYVPAALVDTYIADASWNRYASQIRAIEDYPNIVGGEV